MTKHFFTLIARTLALSALACAGAAQAQSGGTYVGIGIGDANDHGTAYKLYGGAAFHPSFGWEAQYLDFGHSGNERSPYALGASVVGHIPFQNNLYGFAKVGVHYLNVRYDSSTELGAGVGLLWQTAPQWGLRAEYENIGGRGGDVFSVGMQLRF